MQGGRGNYDCGHESVTTARTARSMSELIEDTQEDKIKLLVFFRGYRTCWFLPLVSLDHYCFTLYTHIEILAVLVINN